jgi:hypothetical protein
MANETQKYTLGRGEVFFNKFKPGTNIGEGERYLGNTPEYSLTNDVETLDHFNSDRGLREKDESVLLEISSSGSMNCDNISGENVALFFLGNLMTKSSTSVTAQKEIFTAWKRGHTLQLGTTDTTPTGVRKVSNVKVGKAASSANINLTGDIGSIAGVTVISADGNYEVDTELGRLYIEPTSAEINGDIKLVVQFDVAAQSRQMVVSSNDVVQGSLRFVAHNAKGENKDYFFPKVTLSPDGDYNLKGDDWQSMGFTFEALKLPGRERVYIDIREVDESGGNPADLRYVSVAPAKLTGPANTPISFTVTVRDGNNNTVPGQTVTLTASNSGVLSEPSENTGFDGSFVATVNKTAAGAVAVTATVQSAAGPVSATSANITFS